MELRPFMFIAAAAVSAAIFGLPASPASANGTQQGGYIPSGPTCPTSKGISIYKPVTINKNVNIYKPVTITKNIDVYKPVTIEKNISIYKPITIDKNIDITKNIDDSKNISIEKNITINKSIVINKGNTDVTVSAMASAMASATANANSGSNSGSTSGSSAGANAGANAGTIVYSGSYQYVTIHNHGGSAMQLQAEEQCEYQAATVVKAIHAVCIAGEGHEFPASHMVPDTFINSSYEGEIMRCLPGSRLKVVIGDVLQSDQGMAGTYEGGQVIMCAEHEALGHYKDGMLKCIPAQPVKDCTERTNLRLYGTGDLFFSFRAQVCVKAKTAEAHAVEVTGMTLDGGVGDGSDGY
jgi:hypothetical protein